MREAVGKAVGVLARSLARTSNTKPAGRICAERLCFGDQVAVSARRDRYGMRNNRMNQTMPRERQSSTPWACLSAP